MRDRTEKMEAVLAFLIGIVPALIALGRIVTAIVFNSKILRRVKRSAPACLTDNSLGEHNYVRTASNIRIHYVAKGDENKPLMLLVHGFPEFWYSWRHQLKEFGDQHRVVAMDMRGYGDSDSPQGKEHYKLHLLTTDIKETVEALGHTSCVLVAHDWGGVLAWRVAHEYPGIVDKLIILNGPHSGVFKKYLRSHWAQFKKSLYMFFFQIPYVPELALRLNDMETLVSIFKSKRSGIKKPNMFTDEDMEAYKYTFGRPGAFTPPLNYYRNAFNKGQLSRSWIKKLTVPVLVIWGTGDMALESGLLDGIEEYVENLTIRRIEGASHWVQQDEPALVNSYIRQFVYSN